MTVTLNFFIQGDITAWITITHSHMLPVACHSHLSKIYNFLFCFIKHLAVNIYIIWRQIFTRSYLRNYYAVGSQIYTTPSLTFWRRNYYFNFSTPCIWNVNNTGTKYVRIMKQTAFWRGKNGEYIPCLKYSVHIFVK